LEAHLNARGVCDGLEPGRRQLEAVQALQQRYGFATDQIHRDVDDWFRTLK
jgi:hypothetical protein